MASRPTPPLTDAPPADPDTDPVSVVTAPDRGVFRSLRTRNFRLYAGGQLVSLTGTWMQRVAQDWLVLELTNSGTALGIVTALQFGPQLVLGLWGGVIADRGDKRRILFATQTGLALLALVLGVLDVAGIVTYWQVLVLALVLGVVTAVDTPVRQSFVVEMVGRDDLANAVGINSTIFNTGRILGPAVAGAMISAVGTGWAFVANAASSVAVLAGLALMRREELVPSPVIRRGPGQLREGFAYVRARADLVLTMVLVSVVGTFGLNFQITSALLAKDVFHRGASGYGLLSTFLALGAVVGAVLAARRVQRPSPGFLLLAVAGFGAIEVVSGLMPTFLLSALALIPTGLAMLTVTTAANSSVQLGVSPTMRGRVMALYLVCFLGGTPIGAPVAGWIGEWAGPRWAVVGGGTVCVLSAITVAVVHARRRGIAAVELPARAAARLRPA